MATSVGSVVFSLSADIKDIQAQLRQIEGQFGNTAKKIESSFGNIKTSLGRVFTATAVIAFGKSIVDASLTLERINNTLKAVSGSAEAAAAEFAFVKDEAKRLGLDLGTAAQQYANLAAAAKNTSIQGSKTRDIFIAVSEAATVLGLSADQTGGALNAIQQIISKGTVSSEELRQQLGERLPGAFQTAARAMGVTTVELGKLLEEGKISASDFLPRFAAELRKTFGSGVPDAINSTQAAINRLNTAWLELRNSVGSSGFIDAVALSLNAATASANALVVGIQRLNAALGLKTTKAFEFEGLESTVKRLSEALARASGLDIGKIASAPTAEIEKLGRNSNIAAVKGAASGLLSARKALQDFLSKSSLATGPGAEIPGIKEAGKAPPPVIDDKKKTDKLKAALESYTESLQKAIEKEEEQRIKLQFGELTALKAAQAFDTLALKEKLLADGLKIPANVSTDVANATQFLQSLGVNVAQLSSKDFPALRDEYLKLADANEELARAVKTLDDEYSVSNENLLQQTQLTREQAAQLARLKQEFADLVQTQQIGAIKDPEQRRIAAIEVDFAKTAARIKELGEATGKSQAEIAAAIGEAWKKSLNEITDKVDEASQFQIEALRKIQDGVASFIEDGLNGNLKGWQAWADGVRKAINGVIAQFLGSKFNELFFGNETKAGKIGGVAGSLFEKVQELFGANSASSTNANTTPPSGGAPISREPFDGGGIGASIVDAVKSLFGGSGGAATSLGGPLTTAAIAAINSQAAVSTAGIQSQVAIGVAAVEAVQTAALAAIQAASASGGGGGGGGLSGLLGLFGGSGSSGGGLGGVSAGSLADLVTGLGYANGGRPRPFMPALVGERGPELFVPDTAGTIIPNNKLAGVAGAQIVMNVYAQDAASFARSEHAITARMGGALARAQNR